MSRWQLLPPLTAEELDTLQTDILANGITDPVELDTAGEVIDGHHRVAIAQELGIDYPTVVRDWDEQRIVEHVFRKHLGRRNLTTEQRHDVVRAMRSRLRWGPIRIATALGVSDDTVRRDLARTADAVADERLLGADGKRYPAHRTAPGDPFPMTDVHRAKFPELAAAELSRDVARGLYAFAKPGTFEPDEWADRVGRFRSEDVAQVRQHVAYVRRWVEKWERLLEPRLSVVGGPE